MLSKDETFRQAEARFERTEPHRPAIACETCGETYRYTDASGSSRCLRCDHGFPHGCPGCGTVYTMGTRHACNQLR